MNWYSIKGSDKDGWFMTVYEYVPYKYVDGAETVTPKWNKAKEYNNLEELFEHLKQLREEENNGI